MEPSPQTKPVFEFGAFRLDGTILDYRGVLVPLAPKAIDLLYLLVSRAPTTVTKEEILQGVWPDTYVVESSLARNISVIRKALEEKGGAGPYIETIPTRGYRFVASLTPEPLAPSDSVAHTSAATPWPKRILAATLLALLAGAGWWISSRRRLESPTEKIGRHLLDQVTPAEAVKALAYFEAAIKANPNSSAAHAGLAEVLLILPTLAAGEARSARAKAEAETAVRLDPRNASAHAALGGSQMWADWDFPGAERSFRRALELDPRCLAALSFYSQLLSAAGRGGEALPAIQKARVIDPVSPLIGVQLGRVYYRQHKFEQAAAEFRTVLDREPHFTLAHYYLALSYGFLGQFAEAEKHLTATELNPGVLRTDQAWLRLRQGDRGPAERVYADLRQQVASGQLTGSAPLLLAVALGHLDEAFAALESCLRERSTELMDLQSDPRLDGLRTDPRYTSIVRRIGRVR